MGREAGDTRVASLLQCLQRGSGHLLTRRIVIGTLKGYDQLMNLVLDEVKEALTGMLTPLHTHIAY
jgi:hypothetical protein